jgi:pimeloyl-ACP methyl ester carboxylesterase
MPTMDINGTTLAYDDAGSGAPPLLLVHGWAGNRTIFAPQIAAFGLRHRVVAVDLRGHGQSASSSRQPAGERERDYTIEAASEDLAAVCRALGLDRAVVVQHSYDRLGYDFAARHAELVRALVVLDGPTLAGPEWDAGARKFLDALESDHWQAAIRGYADQAVFAPGTPAEVKEHALAEIFATPRPVLVSTWRNFVAYDTAATLPAVRCPLLYVGGAFPADVARLRELCPQLEVAEVRGRGHLIPLTAADEVNDILAAFVARVSSPTPVS